MLALACSTQRGFGRIHPFVGEIRMGEVEAELMMDNLGFAGSLGDITVTECQMVNQFTGSAEEPATFSGGEQQRVTIALGFAGDHPFMILDEPTASLDVVNSAAVVALIETRKQAGAAFIGIFHDEDVRINATNEAEFFEWRRALRIHIGHDVWIGHGATILPGIKIGNGAVVGAGAVVTKGVEAYMILAGVPAKPLYARFLSNITERLQTLAWWDWSHMALRGALDDFRGLPIETFLEKYEINK